MGHQVTAFAQAHPDNISANYSKYFPAITDYENLSLPNKLSAAINLIYNRKTAKAFAKFLDSFQPDLIHAHNIYGGLTTAILDAAKKKKIPVLITLHDYKLICPSYTLLNRGKICEDCQGGKFKYCLLHRCHKENLAASLVYCLESSYNKWMGKYNSARYLICPSRFSFNKHIQNGISENKLTYLPNFVSIDDYQPNFSPGEYILYAGRLSKEKGAITLLKAVKNISVPVKIVGDGPAKDKCASFVRENKMSHVTFEGYKTGDELKNLFKNAAFLVFPSQCYENAPMTILEAFAYGKPVIGSNVGGIPEMVSDGQTGLLFTMGDHLQLRDKIKSLLDQPAQTETMGKNARQLVTEKFNAKLHYQNLMELYQKTLAG